MVKQLDQGFEPSEASLTSLSAMEISDQWEAIWCAPDDGEDPSILKHVSDEMHRITEEEGEEIESPSTRAIVISWRILRLLRAFVALNKPIGLSRYEGGIIIEWPISSLIAEVDPQGNISVLQ